MRSKTVSTLHRPRGRKVFSALALAKHSLHLKARRWTAQDVWMREECGVALLSRFTAWDDESGRSLAPVSVLNSHTPSIAFRHLPPKEGCDKPVLGVCMLHTPQQGIPPSLAPRSDSMAAPVRAAVQGCCCCCCFVVAVVVVSSSSSSCLLYTSDAADES